MQVTPAAIVAPVIDTLVAFAAGANTGAPQSVTPGLGTAATRICPGTAGSASVKDTPAIGVAFGLVTVKLKRAIPPARIGFGENSLSMTGGRIAVSESVA